MPRRRKARSRVKNNMKKATVERKVASKRMVVKINQPCVVDMSAGALESAGTNK